MICSVGLTCLDIVNFVGKYPEEDTDQRCTSQCWERGGNASNNATVLANLGQPVEFFGTLANDLLLKFFKDDMDSYGIKHDSCPVIDGVGRAPASVVICSEETGTRTIVHCKGSLPELSLDDFKNRIKLSKYSWLHFEGRNETVVSKMMQFANEYNSQNNKEEHFKSIDRSSTFPRYKTALLPISVEVEKRREELHDLIPLAHVVFVGKDFALLQGAKDCKDAAKIMAGKVMPGTLVICPWGDQGAAFSVATGNDQLQIIKVDAFPPSKLVDSLGAGDTFIASTIFGLNKGLDIETSVKLGCRLASEKLSMYGFRGLKDVALTIPECQK